jgi:hypothetical protein
MTEFIEPHTPEENSATRAQRLILQERLMAIDRDPAELGAFIEELYRGHKDNPQVLYAAATHLTSLSYLDHRDKSEVRGELVMPSEQQAMEAFRSYTHLMAMIYQDLSNPMYSLDADPIACRKLLGEREELAFHGVLAYGRALGRPLFALTSPASVNYSGEGAATDIQMFTPPQIKPLLELQIKKAAGNGTAAFDYSRHVIITGLSQALGEQRRNGLLSTLKAIGHREHMAGQPVQVTEEEDAILTSAWDSIIVDLLRRIEASTNQVGE